MANCKICGTPVKSAPVIHPACWETQVDKVAQAFCDHYCRFPFECEQDELDAKCESCPVEQLYKLGGVCDGR